MALKVIPEFLFNSIKTRYIHVSNRHDKLVQFILSDIGEGIREVTVKDWFVKVGDKVSQFDDLCLVESDKASVNITSRYDGTVKRLYHEIGDTAFVGKALVDIDIPEDKDVLEPPKVLELPKEIKKEIKEEKINQKTEIHERVKGIATPAVRRLALMHNISLRNIQGTGKNGRVMKEDIQAYIDKIPKKDSPVAKDAVVSKKPVLSKTEDRTIIISGVKKAMVKSMTLSNSIPSFVYSDEINVTKLVSLREEFKDIAKKRGTNITYMPFFIKALSQALLKYPDLNATVDQNCENMTVKASHNIGIAVDTPEGLMVPNIKNVQNLSIIKIAEELIRITNKAKEKKLSISDITGGTITVSNIGIIGGTYVRPLIYPPEVCILGIGKFQKSPIYVKDELVKAHVCNASWAADHRVIDGATMARFANAWRDYIENPSHLMLNI